MNALLLHSPGGPQHGVKWAVVARDTKIITNHNKERRRNHPGILCVVPREVTLANHNAFHWPCARKSPEKDYKGLHSHNVPAGRRAVQIKFI